MTLTTIPSAIETEENTTTSSLLRTGIVSGVAAAAAAEAFVLGARALEVPMRAADPGAAAAKAIPVGGVAMAVLMNAAVGLLVAAALLRFARASASMWFVAIASTYTVLSLLGPVLASHTELATKVVLGFAHVIAAVIAIPLIVAAMVHNET